MSSKFIFGKEIQFSMRLKSKTNRGRIGEALDELKLIYPYEVERQNIFITKSKEKDEWIVTIGKSAVEKKKTGKFKIYLQVVLLFILAVIIAFILVKRIRQKQLSVQTQKEIEIINEERNKEEEKNRITLEELKKKWEEIQQSKSENIYERISILYSLTESKTVYESISIDDDNFAVELLAKDSTKVLENFETSQNLSQVKMERTTITGNSDYILIKGKFIKHKKTFELPSDISTQIEFYQDLINEDQRLKEYQKNQNIWEYTKNIRNELHVCGCKEQYLQVKGNHENLEVEVLIYSSAEQILNFLKSIQEGKNNLVKIKTVRIRNNDVNKGIQTIVNFKSGISIKENEDIYIDYEEERNNVTVNEISTVLHKEKPVSIQSNKEKAEPKKEIKKERIIKGKLEYVGLTKVDGTSYVMAKDEKTGILYKFQLCKEIVDGDICMENSGNGYIARIKEDWFEVIK